MATVDTRKEILEIQDIVPSVSRAVLIIFDEQAITPSANQLKI